MTSPTSVPLHLLALEQAAQPGALAPGGRRRQRGSAASDAQLRAAIVNVARYYLQLRPDPDARPRWRRSSGTSTSPNGADHGPSCAAFASLTLELAAQAVGQQSWVSGGTSYPWPAARLGRRPGRPQPGLARRHVPGRRRAGSTAAGTPLGDGYRPQPGDWVLFDGHVEVVTSYSGGVLHTIGADSDPA